jgi:hypothetical protein
VSKEAVENRRLEIEHGAWFGLFTVDDWFELAELEENHALLEE